jgi:dihydroflavonol-4-reductase
MTDRSVVLETAGCCFEEQTEMKDRWNMNRNSTLAVITGATGHIGNVLARTLVAQGRPVRAVVLPGEDLAPIQDVRLETVVADIRDSALLERAFAGADTVFHLAGLISISPGQVRLMHEVNVVGTRNAVQAALRARVRRLVYTSSVHAFVEPPGDTALSEATSIDPAHVLGDYGRSKARATHEVLAGVLQGLDAVLVFPSGVIGPYDFRVSEMGQLLLDFCRRRLGAWIDGAYDFADVRDVVQGLILAAEKGRRGGGYVLSGNVVTVREILNLLQELTGIQPPRVRLPYWFARLVSRFTPVYYRLAHRKPRFTTYSLDVLHSNCRMDCSRAQQELGYVCRPARESIADSLQWFRSAGMLPLPGTPTRPTFAPPARLEKGASRS